MHSSVGEKKKTLPTVIEIQVMLQNVLTEEWSSFSKATKCMYEVSVV